MVGGVVKPFRKYISNRIKKSLFINLNDNDKLISYTGIMKHFNALNVKRMIPFISLLAAKYVYLKSNY